nr:chemotaxis protein CheB [Methylocucumis oryzae]
MVGNTGQSDSDVTKEAKAKKLKKPNEKFDGFVVAIGASAGGLDALERLFDQLPSNSGAVLWLCSICRQTIKV